MMGSTGALLGSGSDKSALFADDLPYQGPFLPHKILFRPSFYIINKFTSKDIFTGSILGL